MPKKKNAPFSLSPRFIWLAIIVTLLTLVGFNIFRNTTDNLEINQIDFASGPDYSCDKNILLSFQVSSPCGVQSFSKYTARCTSGRNRIVSHNPDDNGASCKTIGAWLKIAESRCPSVCPSPKPSSTPLPSGCYYQEVQCIQAPCEPILVCPSPAPSGCYYEQYKCKPGLKCQGGSTLVCPSILPISQCVTAPPECVDSSGNFTLCDPKPGTRWCPIEFKPD